MTNRIPRAWLLCVLVAMCMGCLAGCGAALSKETKLGDIVYPFYDAWRWKKVTSLVGRVEPEKREDFAKSYNSANSDVLYADYEVTEVKILEDGVTAHVGVTFHWYRESDPMIVEAQILETWKRAGKSKPWFRVGSMVVVGEMP